MTPSGRRKESSRGVASSLDKMIDEQYREDRRKIKNGVAKCFLRDLIGVMTPYQPRITQKNCIQHQRGRQVNPSAHANDERQQRHRREQYRIQKNMEPGE